MSQFIAAASVAARPAMAAHRGGVNPANSGLHASKVELEKLKAGRK
jgi:hypothetical protein